MIAVLYQCGLRRAEVVSLQLADYDLETGTIRVTGKGHKQRQVYISDGASRAMADWLSVRGDGPAALFCRINKGGKLQSGGLSAQAVYNLLHKRARRAGIVDFSPHDLRRSFVSALLDAGADIATVQRLAGHSSVNTTSRYDRRPEETKRKAAALLHVPYAR